MESKNLTIEVETTPLYLNNYASKVKIDNFCKSTLVDLHFQLSEAQKVEEQLSTGQHVLHQKFKKETEKFATAFNSILDNARKKAENILKSTDFIWYTERIGHAISLRKLALESYFGKIRRDIHSIMSEYSYQKSCIMYSYKEVSFKVLIHQINRNE